MRPRDLPKPLVERVGKHDLLRYALANGWVQESVIPQRFTVLDYPGSSSDQLLIPDNSQADDYVDRVSETIVHIAERCNRNPMHILNALLFVPADVLRFNIAGYDMSRGDLSFDQATRMMQGIKRSMMSAACSVVKPQGFHPRLERREADQLMNACRFRQTETGSFTFVLACPLDAVDSADDVPFVRRTTGLFMRSVSWLASNVNTGRADRSLDDISHPESLSANFCDGLLDMQPDDDQATLSIGTEWEWRYGVAAGCADIGSIRLHREHFAFVAEVGRRLRPKKEDQTPQLHVGRVEVLHGVPDEHGAMQGEVVLTLFAEEETLRRVQTDLVPKAYAEAVDAHKTNRLVSLHGILRRGRRAHRMDDVLDFRMLEETAPSGR